MTNWRAPRATGAMDELIERSFRGSASTDDTARLDTWRRESIANEQHYRSTVQLLTELRALGQGTARRVPSVEAVLARSTPPAPARATWRGWHALAAAGVVAVLALTSYGLVRASRQPAAAAAALAGVGYATDSSEMATVQLSDGSVVRMAPNTTLRFEQTATTREATLDGRAFFTVSRIPGRVFRVRTRVGDATVLGTRFEISTVAAELRLVVVSGRVALSGTSNSVEVTGGHQSGVRNGTALAPEAVPAPEAMEHWVGKFLAFQFTPIREAARQISEEYGLRIVVADSIIGNRTVTGTFTDRPVKQVLEEICAVVKAQCESRPGEVVMTSR